MTAEEIMEQIKIMGNGERLKLLELLYYKHFDRGITWEELQYQKDTDDIDDTDHYTPLETLLSKIEQTILIIQGKQYEHDKLIDLLSGLTTRLEAKTLAYRQFKVKPPIPFHMMNEKDQIESAKAMSDD